MKKYFYILLVVPLFSGCTKEQICDFLYKADLITGLHTPVAQIVLGDIAPVVNKVSNIIAEALDCKNPETMDAPMSNSLFEILFRNSPSEPWIEIGQTTELIINQLLAGKNQVDSLSIEFNEAGEYAFMSAADAIQNKVDERDELNNEYNLSVDANGRVDHLMSRNRILVLPAPDGTRKIEGKEQVLIKSIYTYLN